MHCIQKYRTIMSRPMDWPLSHTVSMDSSVKQWTSDIRSLLHCFYAVLGYFSFLYLHKHGLKCRRGRVQVLTLRWRQQKYSKTQWRWRKSLTGLTTSNQLPMKTYKCTLRIWKGREFYLCFSFVKSTVIDLSKKCMLRKYWLNVYLWSSVFRLKTLVMKCIILFFLYDFFSCWNVCPMVFSTCWNTRCLLYSKS